MLEIDHKENLTSSQEISIKEELEMFGEINNKEKLVSSLKNSKLLSSIR